jgi:hypothetical protein
MRESRRATAFSELQGLAQELFVPRCAKAFCLDATFDGGVLLEQIERDPP